MLTSSPHWAPRTIATIDGLGKGCTAALLRRLPVEGRDAIVISLNLFNGKKRITIWINITLQNIHLEKYYLLYKKETRE
jgi:hypothetical protein